MKVRKAILPAAGLGTRFLPATKAQPKEMLPIVDKPAIQYLVEEAVASGIEEIIIITGRGKRAIEDHFDSSYELEMLLKKKGKLDQLREIQKISKLANFVYIRQPEPLGDGHAILLAKNLIGNEPLAVLFGDDIIRAEVPALQQLIQVYDRVQSSVIAVERVPKDRVSSYGIIGPRDSKGRLHQIGSLVEKPRPADAPSNLAIVGKYIVTPEIFEALERSEPGPDGEIRLIDGLRRLLPKQAVYGYEFEGKRYDTGDKFGFVRATIDFALAHPDLKKPIRSYLKTVLQPPSPIKARRKTVKK